MCYFCPGPSPSPPSPVPSPPSPVPSPPSPVPSPVPSPPSPVPSPPSPVPAPPAGKNTWDHAYFISGGASGVFTKADIGSNNGQVSGNAPNGADPSCGAGDPATMKKCITGSGADTLYGVKYGEGYQAAVADNCSHGSCCIQLVNPPSGKVATLAHGPFGTPLASAVCSTSHYDATLLGGNAAKTFTDRRDKLNAILQNCGKDSNGYTKTHKNSNGTSSCLITTKAFKDAGVKLPGEDGELPVSNDGVAISWGHGVGDGGCGAMALLQQGKASGTQAHTLPGNTTLNYQVGTRAWSGEWSDTVDGRSGYLPDGSNDATAVASSQSCLQPRFRHLSSQEADSLLKTVCGTEMCKDVGKPKPKGVCEGGPACKAGDDDYDWCAAAKPQGCVWKGETK